MSILRKLEPRKRAVDVRRTMPLTHSMEEFLEDFPPRRWMETFEPLGWRWPMGVDYERSLRLDKAEASYANLERELANALFDATDIQALGEAAARRASIYLEEIRARPERHHHFLG